MSLRHERGDYCECGCGRRFKGDWDCIPHHIIEVTTDNVNDVMVSLNPDNLKLLTLHCHNMEHQRFGGAREVYLVWGSPAAGKSTLVEQSCSGDDLIVDIDRCWDAVCLGGRGFKPDALKGEAFALHAALIDRVATRAGKWRTAWVVGGYPRPAEREKLRGRLGAIEVFVDEEEGVCLERCGDDVKRQQYVKDWFDTHRDNTPPPAEDDEGGRGTVKGYEL